MRPAAPRSADDAARRQAATDFERNLVVLAGAGTGKTSLLVERVLNAIGSGRAEVGRIAAITFTEKAAGELRQRVAEGLETLRGLALGETVAVAADPAHRAFAHQRNELGVPEAAIAARCLAALEALDQARLQTIHAFCSELLRAHPVEARVDPDFRVDTGEQRTAALAGAWEAFVEQELGAAPRRLELWQRVLAGSSLEAVTKVAFELADFGLSAALLAVPQAMPTARELLGARAAELGSRVATVRAEVGGLSAKAVAWLGAAQAVLEALAREGHASFAAALAAHAATLENLNYEPDLKRLSGIDSRDLRILCRECGHLIKRLADIDETQLALLVEAVAPFITGFRERFLSQGWVSFDGLLALARDLLRDHPDVRATLKERQRLLFVDEFQDTDPLQYEIILYLAEREGEGAPDAYAARLAPGKLFVVGDPKQSIYRFRGADFQAFRRTVARILAEGGQALDLTGNFRSVAGLLEPVNALFATPQVWRASDYQPPYTPIEPRREGGAGGPCIELWTVALERRTRAAARRLAEGELIAESIEALQVEGRPLRTITLLFRAFASIPAYVRPLRERQIPFVIDGGKDFIRRPEIAQSLAVLRALAQPADAPALLAFLRSPAGGLSDVELAAYAAGGGRWDWRAGADGARFPRIAERFDLLRRLRDATRQLPADAVVRRIVEDAHLLPLAAAAYEGAQRVANLQKLVAAAGRLARDGRLALDEVVLALREGGLADLEADSPLADDCADAVRITSIHKFKGLETEVLYLPDLSRQDHPGRSPGTGTVRLPDGRVALGMRVGERCTPAWVLADLDQEDHDAAEETRVLYVALTRARERLVLVATSDTSSRWLTALAAWGYDPRTPPGDGALLAGDRVLHRRFEPLRATPTTRVEAVQREPQAVAAYQAASRRAREQARPGFDAPSALGTELDDRRGPEGEIRAPATPRGRDLGRAVGIVVHRALERWDGGGERLHRDLTALSLEIARSEQVEPALLAREAQAIGAAFIASPLAERWRSVQPLGREVPLLLQDEAAGVIFRGSIDLVYRDPAGALVVADYKTDLERDEATLRLRYGAQLAVYARAVGQSLGAPGPARAELWLLRHGLRVELEPAASAPTPPRQLGLF